MPLGVCTRYVLVDLKPQNIVIFGSLLTMRLIDLECLRKNGESVPFKLTPFYAAPELAAAALETMRLGQLPPVEYDRVVEGGTLAADQCAINVEDHQSLNSAIYGNYSASLAHSH